MLPEIKQEIEYCLKQVKKEWLAASNTFPDFLIEISPALKIQNEQYIKSFSDNFQKHVKSYPRIPFKQKKWKDKTFDLLKDFLYNESIINIHKSMDQHTIDAFEAELEDFLRHVRKFAPELSFDEIGQAIRNYIVYAMFKEIHQVKTGFSIAGFGYSMLYPFTDNYIDSDQISPQEKSAYNQMIRDKISGKEVYPKTVHQKKTCELLSNIESDYSRDEDTSIYTLLLMMLDAQENSLRQQNRGNRLSPEERLDISLFKGGVSVLIDRYFVRKKLTRDEMIFYLGLGFFLQLADDLQDIKTDSNQGGQTILTLDLSCKEEEKIVNKMLHFIHNIMTSYQAENDLFKNFVLSNCYQLTFTSLGQSKEFFSADYIKNIEKHQLVTYSFLEDWRKNLVINKDKKLQEQYMNMMDYLIADK